MSKLRTVLKNMVSLYSDTLYPEVDPDDILDEDEAREAIKTLILDLFKEVDYDPFEFVAKVKEL